MGGFQSSEASEHRTRNVRLCGPDCLHHTAQLQYSGTGKICTVTFIFKPLLCRIGVDIICVNTGDRIFDTCCRQFGALLTVHIMEHSLLLPPEVLARTPSAADNVSSDDELSYRIFGCELIQEMGIMLRMPQVCMATAQTLLQRFYYRRSLTAFDAHHVAVAALFLAGKVEESTRRMRDILNVCYHCKLKRQSKKIRTIILGGDLYVNWKLALIRTERFILKDLGFCMYNIAEHPHKFILYYVKALGGDAALAQRAWSYLNDSLRLDLCVRYRAEAIACSALYLAARDTGFALPKAVAWHAVFSSTLEEIESIAACILSLYNRPKSGWLPSLRPNCKAEDDIDVGEEASTAAVPAAAGTSAKPAASSAVATAGGAGMDES